MTSQLDRRRDREQSFAGAGRAWALAVVICSACTPAVAPVAPVAPVTSTAPDHDEATASNAPEVDPRAPAAEAAGECKVYDARNPACKASCPNTGSAMDGDACQHCPSPPDPALVACQRTMPCPDPPDRRVRACLPHRKVIADSVIGRVIAIAAAADGVILTVGVGTDQGVDHHWSGTVLAGDTDTPLAGGELVLIRIDKHITVGKVHLTADQLESNNHVRLVR
jgi:hypothetical protein